jgi:hypothetical protein
MLGVSSGSIVWTGDSAVILGDSTSGGMDYWSHRERNWYKQTVATDNGLFDPAEIVWTGSSLIITALADPRNPQNLWPSGSLYYWWQEGGNWNMVTVAIPAPAALYSWPSTAWTDSSVVITASRSGGDLTTSPAGLFYWWGPLGSANISNDIQTVATGNYFFPSIAWTGSSVVIVAADDAGNLNFWQQPKGGSGWSKQTVATPSPGNQFAWPSITWTGSSVVITAVEVPGTVVQNQAVGGNLYYWWGDGTGAWPQAQTVATGNFANPSIAWTGNSVIIAAVEASGASTAGNLCYFWQQAGTTGWNNQIVATGNYSGPSIAWTGISAVITASTSTDIYYWWQGMPPWNMEQVD